MKTSECTNAIAQAIGTLQQRVPYIGKDAKNYTLEKACQGLVFNPVEPSVSLLKATGGRIYVGGEKLVRVFAPDAAKQRDLALPSPPRARLTSVIPDIATPKPRTRRTVRRSPRKTAASVITNSAVAMPSASMQPGAATVTLAVSESTARPERGSRICE